jgi:hypothetical protein
VKKIHRTYDLLLFALFPCYLLLIIDMSILAALSENRCPASYGDRNIMGVIR